MKQFLVKSVLIATLTLSGAQLSYAQYVVFDPTQYATQIPQYAKDIITSAASYANQINTFYLKYKASVLDPLANALIVITLLNQQTATANLVTGALGGNALLKDNPEQWIKNQGLNSVRISLGDISAKNGTYSNSLFGNIVDTYRTSSSLKNTLEGLSNSSIPSIVQTNVCKDASLTNIARNDVTKADGSFDPTELKNRKQDLFNSLCVGNPTININLGKKLEEVGKQRPDIAGQDTFLAIISGDNAYNRAVKAQLAIAEDVGKKTKAAEADLTKGGGIASPTKCADTPVGGPTGATAEGALNIGNVLCRNQVLTGVGSTISSAYQQAINAPIQKLVASFGDGILGSLTTLFTTWNSVKQLSNAFSSLTNDASGTSGGSTGASVGVGLNNATLVPIITPIDRQLTSTLTELTNLEKTHASLLSQVQSQESYASTTKSCFQALIKDSIIAESDARAVAASTYFTRKTTEGASTRASISQEIISIGQVRTLITDTRTKLSQATSSDAVSTAFATYNEKVLTQNLIGASAAAAREGEIASYQGNNMIDRMLGGEGYTLNTQCKDIRDAYNRQNTSN